MPILRTVRSSSRFEIPKIRGSRFLAEVGPIADEAVLSGWLEGIRGEFPDATHHCWGATWPGLSGDVLHRSSDDGEPSGTAGRPILREIRGRDLVGAGVVVVRWYGGTKLGTGGLVRAYSAAAAAVLDRAAILERPVTRGLVIVHSYDLTGVVDGALAARSLEAEDSVYGAEVERLVPVPIEDLDELEEELREASAGRVELRRQTPPGVPVTPRS